MALFKPFRGSRASLDIQPLHDGYAYFCIDDGTFHIDYVDSEGNLQRKQLNAKEAETLGLHSADEFLLKEEIDQTYSAASTNAQSGIAVAEALAQIQGDAIQSDYDQNDETAPDYIKNRPFGEIKGTEIISWDGNIDGKDCIDVYGTGHYAFYKVSDQILSEADFANITSIQAGIMLPDNTDYTSVANLQINSAPELGILLIYSPDLDTIILFSASDEETASNEMGVAVPSKGTYLLRQIIGDDGRFMYVASIKEPDTIKKLDNKFLPDELITTEQVDSKIEEVNNSLSNGLSYKLDKTGGTITGSLTINGDLTVSGTNTSIVTQTLEVKDNVILANSDGMAKLVDNAGFAVKTDSTHAYGIMYDPDADGVKIGLGEIDSNGKFEYYEGEDQLLATRDDSIADGNLVYWDDKEKTLKDANISLREEKSKIYSHTAIGSDKVTGYSKYWDGFLGTLNVVYASFLTPAEPQGYSEIPVKYILTDNSTYWLGCLDGGTYILSFSKAGTFTIDEKTYNVPSAGTYGFNGIAITVRDAIYKLDEKFLPDNVAMKEDLKSLEQKIKPLEDKVNAIPQPDWNQSDETAADYIKNKPKIGGTLSASVIDGVFILEQTGTSYTVGIERDVLILL